MKTVPLLITLLCSFSLILAKESIDENQENIINTRFSSLLPLDAVPPSHDRELQSSSSYTIIIPADTVLSSSALGPRGPKTQRAIIGTVIGFVLVILLLGCIHQRTRQRITAALNNSPSTDLSPAPLPSLPMMYPMSSTNFNYSSSGTNGERKDNNEEGSSIPNNPPYPSPLHPSIPTSQRPDIIAIKRISPKIVAIGVLNLLVWIFGFAATYAPWGGKWYTAIVNSNIYDVHLSMTLFDGIVCTSQDSGSYSYYYYSTCDFGSIAHMYTNYPEAYSDLSSSQLAVTTAHFASWLALITAVVALLTHREIRRKWTIAFRGPHVRADCCISADHPVCPDCCGVDYEQNGPMPGKYRCTDSSDGGPRDTCCSYNRLHTSVCNLRNVYILNAVSLVLWVITWSAGMTPFVYSNNGTRAGGNFLQLQGGFAMAIVCYIFVFLTTLLAGLALRDGIDNNALITGMYSLADLSVGGQPSGLSISGSPNATGPHAGAPVPASVPYMMPNYGGMNNNVPPVMPGMVPNMPPGYYPSTGGGNFGNNTNTVYPATTTYPPTYPPGTTMPPYPGSMGPVSTYPYNNPMMPYGQPMNNNMFNNSKVNTNNASLSINNDDNPSTINPDVPRKTMTTLPQAAVINNTSSAVPSMYPSYGGRPPMGNPPSMGPTNGMNNSNVTNVPPGYMMIMVPGPNGQPTQAMVPMQYASTMTNSLPNNNNNIRNNAGGGNY